MDGVWIGNRIYWTLIQRVTTRYKSLLHTDPCSQSRCLVTASNSGRSVASGLTSSQAGDHLTPTSDCLYFLQLLAPGLKLPTAATRLALASTVILGFESHQGPRPYFFLFKTFTCFEMGVPLQREEGYNYYWLFPLYNSTAELDLVI
jgi:hypothetical protein